MWSLGLYKETILAGTGCAVVTGTIAFGLISWYESYNYGSQNEHGLYWSDFSGFLKGLPCIWTRKADWENLPLELWGEVGKRMVSNLDIASFRLVCKKMHSSLPPPTTLFPLSLPPPPCCLPASQEKPFCIRELNIFRDQLGFPLVQVGQGDIQGLTKLRQSAARLNDRKFLKLPFFAKVHYPECALDPRTRYIYGHELTRKVALISSSNARGLNFNYTRMCDLSVVAHLGGDMKGRLALLRLGGSPANWAWDIRFCTRHFVSIATYKGQLCAVDHGGRVYLMDYDLLTFDLICAPPSVPSGLEHKRLIEAYGELYLIGFDIPSAEAYKLSLHHQEWIKV